MKTTETGNQGHGDGALSGFSLLQSNCSVTGQGKVPTTPSRGRHEAVNANLETASTDGDSRISRACGARQRKAHVQCLYRSESISMCILSGHRLQETQQRFVGGGGAFGLDPMAGAFDDHFAAQVRHPLIHCGQQVAACKRKHEVFFAGDEKGGLLDFGVFELRCDSEIAIDVAIQLSGPRKPLCWYWAT